jgi:ATP-dependent helicase/nuclease subunit B
VTVDPFINQIADLCRTHQTPAKWVFVPSHAVGHTLAERLALEGTNWANLRVITPLDLARQMAAPFLVEREIDPAPDTLGPALIMRLLLELPGSLPRYFRPLAEHAQMADALWGTIRELRMAGLTAADLPKHALLSADKHDEFRALLSAYEAHLAEKRLADQAAVFQEALRHLDLCPVLPEDVRTELPGVIWAPLERRLLDVLPGHRLPPAARLLPGLDPPRRLTALASPSALGKPVAASDAERLAFLLAPTTAPPPQQDGTVTMFRAGGKEAEVEEVFRRILASGIPFDQVEIACAGSDYAVLLWEKAQRHDWPITVGPGIPITVTRPARALLAFCTWIADGFPAAGLRRLLQSGDVRLDPEDGPTAGQAARLLAESNATWGRQTYAGALTALAESYRERAADIEADDEARARYAARAAQVGRLGEWIHGHLAAVPEPAPDGRVSLGALLTACAGFVETAAARGSALDGAAVLAITEALDELGMLGSFTRPFDDAVAFIRDRIAEMTVGGDRARPGHLHVSSLIHAAYAGRPHTFVVGLEEGGVFPALIEDPVLLDAEREWLGSALDLTLPTSRDRVSEALGAVIARLASLGGRVCLSFSCRDLRESRETFPSWLLLQALRLQRPGEDLTYDHLNQALGEPVSVVPSRRELALSDAGWWLASLRGAGSAGRAIVSSTFPGLARGEAAEAARDSDVFTVYDGFVRDAGARLDPRRSGRAVSASGLESLAACPFRYFLERGLGVEPIEEAEPDPDQWLDPLTRGLALHALYATLLRELRQTHEAPDPGRHTPRLRSLGERKLAELRALIPPPSESVFDREREEFLRDLDLFLSLEAEPSGRAPARVPVGLEVSFGADTAEGERLAQPDPVTLDLGAGLRFRLRGRIDRLDQLPDASVEVVDYKTGRYRPDDWAGTFAGGRVLQHALYALAAGQLLGGQDTQAHVTSSIYYFPTVRGQGQRVSRPQADPGPVAALLRDLFGLLAGGTFLHTANEQDCRYCEFHRACGRDPVARAARKLENPANAALTAYRRLADHA